VTIYTPSPNIPHAILGQLLFSPLHPTHTCNQTQNLSFLVGSSHYSEHYYINLSIRPYAIFNYSRLFYLMLFSINLSYFILCYFILFNPMCFFNYFILCYYILSYLKLSTLGYSKLFSTIPHKVHFGCSRLFKVIQSYRSRMKIRSLSIAVLMKQCQKKSKANYSSNLER